MRLQSFLRRRITARSFQILLLSLVLIALYAYLQSPSRGLTYRDSFAQGNANEWKAFGGTWELSNSMMRNDSDERGAKLLTGSPNWRNYSVEADISLLGISGDAGLVIRSSNEEEGVDAYSGYYAGIRTIDNSLVLGRAEHGWMEIAKRNPAPSVIRPFNWYHLKLLAYNCQIAVALTTPSKAALTSLAINDHDCIHSGRVGLRSYSSGGVWRNVVVHPVTRQDLAEMIRGMAGEGGFEPRSGVAENAESFRQQPSTGHPPSSARTTSSIQTIASLRLSSFAKPVIATIRGVVVLTVPQLFVQDSTGGVYVPQPQTPLLKVGDEVEVTGEVHPGEFSSTMEHATAQVLWARTPMPPISVTASQASTGAYDATFIEVRGRLANKEHGPDTTLILDLDDGSQSFRAIMNPGRSDYLFGKLKLGSILHLRGICVSNSAFTKSLRPFVILLRSNEDLEVMSGPPWWSTEHIIAIVIGSLLLSLVALFLYHRVERWRFRTILEERERLAHEMHDTLAQSFAGIGFQLQAIHNGLPNELTKLHQQLELASDLVRHSHEEARRSIATLRTEALESEDILSALEHCARRMVAGGAVEVVSEREGGHRPIPLRIADALYHIGQEAIANAVRHAVPTLLKIQLTYGGDSVCLQIEDNGRGFVQGTGLLGFGIRGMRRRADSISGAFQLQSKPGEGTRVRIKAPLPFRVTFTSWPKLLWKHIREHDVYGRPTKHTNSHSYCR